MFRNFIKIAWRNLAKNKVTGFINIAGLAIGMSVAIMIGMWMHDELTYNQYYKNYDRLSQLYIHQVFNEHKGTGDAISLPCAPGLRNQFGSEFEHVALASWNFEHLLMHGDKKILQDGMFAEPAFPEMFTLDMIAGDYGEVLKEPNSIILNETIAEALFGSENPVGKTIRLDSKSDLEVTGIFKDFPHNTELRNTNYFISWAHYVANNEWIKNAEDSWNNHSFQLFAQITEAADFETVSAKISGMEKEHNEYGEAELFLFPMSQWHLYSSFEEGHNVGGRIQYVRLFGIIGIFVLLLACINFMNLSTARSEKRAKEVGIRKTIGSKRGQLIGQFLSESLLVVFLGLAFAIALVQISLPWFNNLADKEVFLPWNTTVFWLLALGFTLFTGLLAGSYPAFYLSSFKPLKVLKGTFKVGRGAAAPRQILVTLQFTVSVALIIGTIVVFQQIQHAKDRPVGYNKEGIIQFFHNTELEGKETVFRDELLKSGVVEEASYASGPITNIWSNQIGFEWDGMDPNTNPLFGIVACSHELGKTVGWEILEGRDFSREFSTDTSGLVLNEAAVELVGMEDIVDKTIRWNEKPYKVIGVVKNMIMDSPWDPIQPTIFCYRANWTSVHLVKLKPGVPVQSALASVKNIFEKHSPNTPFEYEFVDDEYNEKFISEERVGKLARVFAILAIFISCLGLFGLSAYVAEQRTKEIGIRKVLGATVTNLWAMQSKGFVVLVILSCFIAAPIAWYYLDNWLADYEYRIQLGWGVFLIATVLAFLVTLATVSFQSIKAALANPVESLRSE